MSEIISEEEPADHSIEQQERVIEGLSNRLVSAEETEILLAILRRITVAEVAQIYTTAMTKGFLGNPLPPLNMSNAIRRVGRHNDYVGHLRDIVRGMNLKDCSVMDLGCGDAEITTQSFADIQNLDLAGCDVVDYLSERTRLLIRFTLLSALDFVRKGVETGFKADVVMENVMLHHLPSREIYREVATGMLDLVSPGGAVLVTETIHEEHDHATHLRNALLDIYLNDLTSMQTAGRRVIPVPVQFLSEQALEALWLGHGATFEKFPMSMTQCDPKRHVTYIVRK